MSQTAQDILKHLEGTTEDQVVALIKAIHELRGEKKPCAKCACSPCSCGKAKAKASCGSCGCSPCCCAKPKSGCGSCNSTPCCCDPCRPNIGDYLLELGRLNLCFYEQLFAVNKKFHTTLSSSICLPQWPTVCCVTCNATPCCCDSSSELQKTLLLEGEVGTKAIGTFTIENSSRTDREVTFLLGEFRGEGKDAKRFVPTLDFTLVDGEGDAIDDRVLDKGDTATVTMGIDLTGDFGAVGTYHGTVVVQSHCTIRLHVCVTVLAAGGAKPIVTKPEVKGGQVPQPVFEDEPQDVAIGEIIKKQG